MMHMELHLFRKFNILYILKDDVLYFKVYPENIWKESIYVSVGQLRGKDVHDLSLLLIFDDQ